MAYSYDDGSTTPGYAGSITVGGIRLNSSIPDATHPAGGTFKVDDTGNPFLMTPPVRNTVVPLSSDSGGSLGPQFWDPWPFTLTGWLWVPSGPDDIAGAEDQLRGVFTAGNGLLTLVGNRRNWATQRQLQAQTNGPITFTARHGTLRIATRNFSIPMVAPDPLAYDATNVRTTDVPMTNTPTAVVSSGGVPTPFTARFTGPFTTSATLTRASDGATITLGSASNPFTLAAGAYVDVTVNAASPNVISAVRNDGVNVFYAITAFSALRILPGSNNWTATATSGTTGASKVTFTWRDAWA